MDYVYKTQPFAHQRTVFEQSRNAEVFALLWEMGTGKSKLIIDNAAWLYGQGKIDALVVVAPNGVHRNWVTREIPAHMPDHIEYVSSYWASVPRKAEQETWDKCWRVYEGMMPLRIFCFNVEGFKPKSKSALELRKILNAFRCLLVIDESHKIKTPGAKRTKTLINLGKYAPYRRILTGTMITNSPLDAYSQFRFLDPYILDFQTFTAFKSYYAVMERRRTNNNRLGYYDEIIGYQNLEHLKTKIHRHASRIKKEECLDLPEKIYERYPVELTKEQRRVYKGLLDNSMVVINNEEGLNIVNEEELWNYLIDRDKGVVRAPNALVKLLRLQQVLGNYLNDEDGMTHRISEKNPRLEVLIDILEQVSGSVIIWARFRKEIADIANTLRKTFGRDSVVEYHGGVDNKEREWNVDEFQSGSAPYFVGQPHSGGLGLTLTKATTVVYYSNDFSYDARRQSEDRAHRIGQKKNVTYIDIIAQDTIDEKIVGVLLNKHKIAEEILCQSSM